MKFSRGIAWGEKDQTELARLTGLDKSHVYRGDHARKWSMRARETLVMFDLRAFGPERKDWVAGLAKATEPGAVVVMLSREGKEIARCKSADGALAMHETLANIKRELSSPSAEKKAARAKANAERLAAREAMREKVRKIWFDHKRYPMEETAVAAIKLLGWTRRQAFAAFNGRGTKRGPKPGAKPKVR